MKVKCPCGCNYVFEAIEHPAPIIDVETRETVYSQLSPPKQPMSKLISYGQSQPVGSKSVISSLSSVSQHQPSISNVSSGMENLPSTAYTHELKKGYKEIIDTIKKYDGATWKDLERDTKLSTKTIAKRLKEGEDSGLFKRDAKKIDKKMYTMYKL